MSSASKPQAPDVEPKYDPSRPLPDTDLLYTHPIPDVAGKSIVAFKVTCPPNAATPPHTHAGAFVSAYLDTGYVLNRMNNEPMQVHGPGETWKENPGCHHRICENLSRTEEAVFYVTMIVDTEIIEQNGIRGLLVIDEEYREMVEKAHGGS